ncbi:hypothetical protein [Lysobacter gummosus]|uniref:hypothetical protein n=1 Tax=Lysobacter gummosus TaxID=262324 RepID=UPI003629C11A
MLATPPAFPFLPRKPSRLTSRRFPTRPTTYRQQSCSSGPAISDDERGRQRGRAHTSKRDRRTRRSRFEATATPALRRALRFFPPMQWPVQPTAHPVCTTQRFFRSFRLGVAAAAGTTYSLSLRISLSQSSRSLPSVSINVRI